MSHIVCEVCAQHQVRWRNPAAPLTTAADHVMRLVRALNALPAYVLPGEILDAAWDTEWRRSAADDPEAGFGDDGEADVVNSVGSALFLAASLPDIYGVPGTRPMRCFGFPLPASLLSLSPVRNSSGVGVVDNRRHNVWEAGLTHWQDDACGRKNERDLLQAALAAMRLAVDSIARGLSWQVARHALQADVALQTRCSTTFHQ